MTPHRLFPGIPLIESPLFEVHLNDMNLNDLERDVALQLHRDGYAIIDFPDPQIDARIDRIKQRLAPQFGLELDDVGAVKTGDKRIQDAWKFDPDVKAIAANNDILALLEKLYGRPAFPFQTLNFPVGTEQAPHSDSIHFSSIPERFMCGVWLAMEDVGPNSGPLCYVPGSHRWPILSNVMIGRRGWGSMERSAQDPFQESWDAIVDSVGVEKITFEAKKGQALIWCANLLHGGSRRHDNRLTRWSQVTHYYFDNCVYYTPAFSDEPLGRLAIREIYNVAVDGPQPNMYLGERIEAPCVPREDRFFPWGGWPKKVRKALRSIRFGA